METAAGDDESCEHEGHRGLCHGVTSHSAGRTIASRDCGQRPRPRSPAVRCGWPARAPSRPRRLPGPGPRSPSARAGRNTGPVPRPHPERSYLPGSPPNVPQPLSTSPQTATLTSCQVRRLRRRWPDASVGLRPWEAPADARRATPHGAQMNPPRVCSRATSTSTWRRRISADTSPAALTRTSRCTRFLPTFGSGTRWSSTRGLALADQPPLTRTHPRRQPTARNPASSRSPLEARRPRSRAPLPRKSPAAQDRHGQSPPGVVSPPDHHPRTARVR